MKCSASFGLLTPIEMKKLGVLQSTLANVHLK